MTMTEAAAAGQVNASAAEIYDAFFVPALFGAWAAPLCDAAQLKPGDRVLDIACGTGATTREAQCRVASGGQITGLDCNPGMLAVARKRLPEAEFIEGRAEDLPFGDARYDAVLCQFGLMFFDDQTKALHEAARVLRPGGRLALSVWDRVENSPGYARMIALLDRLFGAEVAGALRAPFILGDIDDLKQLLADSELPTAEITTQNGSARFASIAEWVRMDVRGWTLSDMIDDDQYAHLVSEAETEFADLVAGDGSVSFAAPAHIVSWKRNANPSL